MTHQKQPKSFVSSSPPPSRGCNRSHMLHPWPDGGLEETNWFLLFLMCHWTMGFNSDKTYKVFIARQDTDARYWYSNSVCPSVRPSVCLSVRNVPVCDENGLTYRHSFFHRTVAQSFLFYQHQTSSRNSDSVTPCGGAKYRWGMKISRLSTSKSLYLANDTRYRHSYYGRRIGTIYQMVPFPMTLNEP